MRIANTKFKKVVLIIISIIVIVIFVLVIFISSITKYLVEKYDEEYVVKRHNRKPVVYKIK